MVIDNQYTGRDPDFYIYFTAQTYEDEVHGLAWILFQEAAPLYSQSILISCYSRSHAQITALFNALVYFMRVSILFKKPGLIIKTDDPEMLLDMKHNKMPEYLPVNLQNGWTRIQDVIRKSQPVKWRIVSAKVNQGCIDACNQQYKNYKDGMIVSKGS